MAFKRANWQKLLVCVLKKGVLDIQEMGLLKRLFILCGQHLAGKTTLAAQFIARGGVHVIHTDDMSLGDGDVSRQDRVLSVLRQQMSTGQNIVLDGAHGSRAARDAYRQLAQAFQYDPVVIWLRTPLDLILKRRAQRQAHPDGQTLPDAQFQAARQRFEPPDDDETVIIAPDDQWPEWIDSLLNLNGSAPLK